MEFIEFSLGRPSKRKKIRRNRRQIPKKKERKEKQKQSWKNESSLGAALGKSRRDQRLYFIIPYTVTQRDSPLRWSTRQKGPVRKKERDNGLCCERTRDLFWSNHTNESMLWLLNKKRLLCVCVCWERNSHHNNVRRHLLLITAITQYATL